MVEDQIRRRGVADPLVLKAMTRVERHLFVPDADLAAAYGDHPLPIGHHQTISQPYIVAFMTEALRLKGPETILEIGTGCGYQTAVLAEIAARVFSLERVEALSRAASDRLSAMGYENVSLKTGDGRLGWPEEGPFHGILVTAAPEQLPEGLIDQLVPEGRLVIPLGTGDQTLKRFTRKDRGYEEESLLAVRFVPLL